MATIILSAAGYAAGNAIGGGIGALTSAAIGRAAGAVVGARIDQKLLGVGSDVVEAGRIDTFRLSHASEGNPIGRVFGRMRVGGQVIWSSRFLEHTSQSGGGGGKGTSPATPTTITYTYTVSLAIALCEGPIIGVSRVWADGQEVSPSTLNMRVYPGSLTQLPDPKIEATEADGTVPAFRGTAYVVFEDLELTPFGNRVPQFSFEVLRAGDLPDERSISESIQAVALMPGSGEYVLATEPVYRTTGLGQTDVLNVNSPSGEADMVVSTRALATELPRCKATSLVVSWFGDDLRCGSCSLVPKVEQIEVDASNMGWRVSGIHRSAAQQVIMDQGRPLYGGTPTDASVIQAIHHLRESGQEVMFYPFILMDQQAGNDLPDPYSGTIGQPPLPWRGRITTSLAPGVAGSPDRTAQAEEEVGAFFGTAGVDDFRVSDTTVTYTGPAQYSFRRFILHYAHLCKAAGGVEAFCIGSEMRALTQIRGAGDIFPAVEALRTLANDVKKILPNTQVTYAADWSEYFGYQPQDGSGDRYFHLDPLWADPAIDFIGIDNYMPLSDWRDGTRHLDAPWGSIYNLEYLKSNVAGGEGYDWYYQSDDDRDAQIRTPITDEGESEPWVWRYKDIANWWKNNHHDRVNGGQRLLTSTAWEPMMKPIRFTEFGCAAIDKGTNEPNKFLDPKSSESATPHYSSGNRDDLIQLQYIRAVTEYWEDTDNNPLSDVYEGRMLDMTKAYYWAWDARPYPEFPAKSDVWSDGENYAQGHWITGRTVSQPLSAVVREICAASGVTDIDVSNLHGLVRGYHLDSIMSAREALQPLMLAFGFDAVERDGKIVFFNRTGIPVRELVIDDLALSNDQETLQLTRDSATEVAGRIGLSYFESGGDFAQRAIETALPDEESLTVSKTSLPLAMLASEAHAVTERWALETRAARDTVRFTLPPSVSDLGVGDVVTLNIAGQSDHYRIDQLEDVGIRNVDAVRVDMASYAVQPSLVDTMGYTGVIPPVPVAALFLDLPLIDGDEVAHLPHLAVASDPWPGTVAVYRSTTDADFELAKAITARATIGTLESILPQGAPGLWDNGAQVRVRLTSGTLSSITKEALLSGGNRAAIGSGTDDQWEVIQFADAELMADGSYALSTRLRGQYGTDHAIPQAWPAGSIFVLLDGAVDQLSFASSLRGVSLTYRIGPAGVPLSDPTYSETRRAFYGVGMRPYRPCHMTIEPDASGWSVSWIRRTRIDGDLWEASDVPLGEDQEMYAVRVRSLTGVVRETTVTTPQWHYTLEQQREDGNLEDLTVEVAQISDRYGPGPYLSQDFSQSLAQDLA